MEKINETVNSRIASYRKRAGLTQAEAASLLNMKRNTYARMEKMGSPSPEQLKQIAELYRISVAMLLYGEDFGLGSDSGRSDKLILREPSNDDIFPLTPTEINAIRLVRSFGANDAQKIVKLINEIYSKNLTSKQ
ncbi:MAG: helix-turn-helix domain-containing protein [Clostridia bacterium]|nr:helix-turn-helix domain-containing protein [Clostridia bacterium]